MSATALETVSDAKHHGWHDAGHYPLRALTDMEIDAVAGRGCGVDAAVGALVGFQIGGVAGALIGAAIAGGFCVAGNAV